MYTMEDAKTVINRIMTGQTVEIEDQGYRRYLDSMLIFMLRWERDLPVRCDLLDESAPYGCVRNDPFRGKQVAASAAPGPQPLLVQPEHVGV